MSTLAILDWPVINAMKVSVSALRRIANYRLPAEMDRRMLDLGERKEFLTEEEYRELTTLVSFTQARSLEKLEAELALQQIERLWNGSLS